MNAMRRVRGRAGRKNALGGEQMRGQGVWH